MQAGLIKRPMSIEDIVRLANKNLFKADIIFVSNFKITFNKIYTPKNICIMKTTINTCLAAILLLAVSCTKESIHNSSAVSTQSLDKAVTFTIGDHYGGGIIFYIDTTGLHGMIADEADLGAIRWNSADFIITGAKGKIIGRGKRNTKKIVTAMGTSVSYAALLCDQSVKNGYTDWYLPSRDELNELYKQRNVIGGFQTDAGVSTYWSSSEAINYKARCQIFYSGAQVVNLQYQPLNVRAVRDF